MIKLNTKRSVLLVSNGAESVEWQVPYQLLFPIINADLDDIDSNNNTLLPVLCHE